MPRKRRSHRKRNNLPNSANKLGVHIGCNTDQMMAGINVTPIRAIKDSFQLETPVRVPVRSKSMEKLSDEYNPNCSLYKTPINKRRSLHRQNGDDLSGTLNVTNLNVLFDNLETPRSATNVLIKSRDYTKRSSSTPRGQVSGKPLTAHKSTQTYCNNEETLKEVIVETPKISNRTKSIQDLDAKNSRSEKHLSHINLNPYLKDRDVIQLALESKSIGFKQNVEEPLFPCYQPNLHWSSTPIDPLSSKLESVKRDNMQLQGGVLNNGTPDRNLLRDTIKEQIFNESIDRISIGVKSRFDNVNLNTPPQTDKVQNKVLTHSNKLLRNRKHVRITPKCNRLLNRSRTFNCVSNNDLHRRSLLDDSVDRRSARIGMYETMLNRLKRYSRESVKWSCKIMNTCAHLGVQIKNNFPWFCHVNQNHSTLLESPPSSCGCDGYKFELTTINTKIEQLNKKLDESGMEMQQILKNELTEFRSDLKLIKDELLNLKAAKTLTMEKTPIKVLQPCNPPAIPPPPPPPLPVPTAGPAPPPPPPPPPMPAIHKPPPMLALTKKSKSTLGIISEKKDCRPAITVDDLRKVKLKKATVRQSSVSRARVASPKPVDLLEQMKLRRRTAQNLSTLSTPNASISSRSDSTSPASSLKRLLETDTVGRVKRLRNVGRSFDSVRRKPQKSPGRFLNRERSGS